MTPSIESKPEQTEPSTQDLPPTSLAKEMEDWDEKKVLSWIQGRSRNILKGDNLENFKKGCFIGITFLTSDVDFYESCGLPRGIGHALETLANEVKGGKFIPCA
jgi:hypothetical protein